MTDGVRVEGADDLRRLAASLKELGDRDLKKQVTARIRTAAKPLGEEVVREGSRVIPAGGGLRARIERTRPGVYVTSSRVGIRLSRLAGYDRGIVKHPVFGNKDVWVSQRIKSDAFTEAFQRHAGDVADEVRDAVQDSLNDVARRF